MFFKKSILISLAGHLAAFGIFSFSFGTKFPQINYPGIYFRGPILNNNDLDVPGAKKTFFSQKVKNDTNIILNKIKPEDTKIIFSYGFLKPSVSPSLSGTKFEFIKKEGLPLGNKAKPAIMFYPRLPEYFNIYFKDRQVVHIELLFNISSKDSATSIEVKRKVSSGNLEADLLSMRYITHYLFVQKNSFAPNIWQSVKIDLSPKND